MPDVLHYDTPIRPIKPGDAPARPDRLPDPAPATFIDALHALFAGLLGR